MFREIKSTTKNIMFTLVLCLLMVMSVPGAVFAEGDVIVPGDNPFGDGDRIWFFNMAGGEFGADMILVESDGRYGLIDAGNRYQDTIEDADGTVYEVSRDMELSCQTAGRNGRDAMIYMVETLGVDHLDFIIATHSHSDHIGGIPEIVELDIAGDNGDIHSLIDTSTVYFYKSYRHISPLEDDMAEKDPASWHNQAFSYQALKSVMSKGAVPLDVTFSSFGDAESFSSIVNNALREISRKTDLTGLNYSAGVQGDPMDDKVSFSWGSMNFDLYNLCPSDGASGENVNCIAAVIEVNGRKAYMAGDIDVQGQREQRIAEAVASDHGIIDLAKVSHHGYNYSNSRELLDLFRPEAMIIASARSNAAEYGPSPSYRSMKYYAEKYCGTEFYEVGAAEKMLAADFENGKLNIYEAVGEGNEAYLIPADNCLDTGMPRDGWSGWYQNFETVDGAFWYYFKDGQPATGWQRIGGDWYCFEEEGFMMANTWVEDEIGKSWIMSNGRFAANKWVRIDGEWYFFKENTYMAVNEWADDSEGICRMGEDGRMLRSTWFTEDGERYYLDASGHLAANMWVRDEVGWMWMDADSRIAKDKWVKSLDEWYYLKPDGYLAMNQWAKDKAGWMWLGDDGKITKNKWIKDGGEWYFLKADGYMAASEWTKDSKGWMWMDAGGRITKNKWIRYKGSWYYLKSNGYLAAGEWTKDSKGWMYMDSSGKITKSKWIQYKGSWYYLKPDGYMATGTLKIDGKNYKFDSSGKWIG